jgi:hypothetical protein
MLYRGFDIQFFNNIICNRAIVHFTELLYYIFDLELSHHFLELDF